MDNYVPTWMDEMSDQYMRGYVAGVAAAREIPHGVMGPCNRCGEWDRIQGAGVFPMDFGGTVTVALCVRCGVVAVMPAGERRN